jgi:hypothetical protein
LNNEIGEVTEAINKRNGIIKDNLSGAEKKYKFDERTIEDQKKDSDRKI